MRTLSAAVAVIRSWLAFLFVCAAAGAGAASAAEPPTWLDSGGRPNRQAAEAVSLLLGAHEDGLDPEDYGAAGLAQAASRLAAESATDAEKSRFEEELTAAVLRLMRHLQVGRVDPGSVGFRVPVREDATDLSSLLRFALSQDRLSLALAELRPSLPQYAALRAALARHRIMAADWASVPMHAWPVPLRPGQEAQGLVPLHRLLVTVGDMPAGTPEPSDPGRYDGALVEGVRSFQRRHGLHDDGVVGKAVRAALGVPAAQRVRQIEFAMERIRWLPPLRGKRVVAINIPMFRLWAAQPGASPPMAMNVIVGKALDTRTPVFMAEMRSVVFRPYWNVPASIVRKELLPLIERDAGYLARHRMEIVRGAGDDASPVEATAGNIALLRRGLLRLRQVPGPSNSLGLVKFVFPNEENVYLHGTPAQALFGRERRDFSHGCVRVQDPLALAQWVLAGQPEWNRDRILEAMEGVRPTHVSLAQPVTVVLYYMTAMVSPGTGRVHFANDLYGHDARLQRALGKAGHL